MNNIITDLINEISRLQKAHDLLQYLYSECGPYWNDDVPKNIGQKINDFFGFDDSE